MSGSILVAYATTRGSTREVAEAVAATLQERGLTTTVRAADEVDDLGPYGGVVLGGALYMGRLHRDARRFLRRHRASLAALPFAVFGMGPGELDEKSVGMSRKQLDRALAKTPDVRPAAVAIFGGVIDPAKLRFPFNRMPRADARDWDAIHVWAEEVATALGAVEVRGATPVTAPAG
ncbi:MAG: flavodoxin domain-containing protein [Gaiellales bacterium]